MNLQTRLRLAPGVAIRPERFGGLAYRYDNRRLYFLHSHELVDLVKGLDGSRSLEEVLEACLLAHDLPQNRREALLKAVAQLETIGILAVQP